MTDTTMPLQQFAQDLVGEDRDVTALEVLVHSFGVTIQVNGISKHVSMDSFIAALTAGSAQGSSSGNIPGIMLPSNTYYFARSAFRIELSCYYTGGVKNIKYFDKDRPSVIPNIIISHSLERSGSDWNLLSSRYFCTDLPVGLLPATFVNAAKPADRIFRLPFTNTYQDGRMCYGGNSMQSIFRNENLRGLDWYYGYLFETPFNDDLGVNGLEGRLSASSWYEKLADRASEGQGFPYEDLRQS